MAAKIEARIHDLLRRLIGTQAKAATDEMRVSETAQELEVSQVIAREKEKEVQYVTWAKLEAQEKAERLRAELEVARLEL